MPQSIPVLYEDEVIIAFNKPSGQTVLPDDKHRKRTLVDIVNQHVLSRSGNLASGRGAMRIHPCHRLDRETSGVILFAKGKRNQQAVMTLFHQRAVRKTYLAFVRGEVTTQQGEIGWPIRDHYDRTGRFLKTPGQAQPARSALTRYRVRERFPEFSVVAVWPVTGRKNQIRIHFKMKGHPVLGERVYAFRKDFKVDTRRLALHAAGIEFRHPVTGRKVSITAPLPEDLAGFLEEQRRRQGGKRET